MATKYLKLRALAALVAFGSLLPVACGGDDDDNPAPGTGGTGAKGGSGGTGAKGGSSGSSGQAGDNGTGGSTAATGGTGAKGGSGGSGAKGGSGGSGAKGGTGNVGGEEAGGNGGETPMPGNECTDLVESNDYPAPCYEDCAPAKTDDSEQFLNRCSDGSQTLGGVPSDCTPWVGTLNALGDGCTKLGDGCVLPDLP